MDKDDREAQALDNLFLAMANWIQCYDGGTSTAAMGIGLFRAYREWEDATKPPGDPHKEWVDAQKMKPDPAMYPVLVKTKGLFYTTLGHWWVAANRWEIQPLGGTSQYVAESDVTHWRYIPEDDDNG